MGNTQYCGQPVLHDTLVAIPICSNAMLDLNETPSA